jgi:hypothetical protein
MDLDGDGVIEVVEPAEDVVYAYNAGTDELTRDSGTGAQTILRNVTAMSFRYYDEDDNLLGPVPLSLDDRAAVRFVEVDISGESDRGEPVSYVTRVLMRNI